MVEIRMNKIVFTMAICLASIAHGDSCVSNIYSCVDNIFKSESGIRPGLLFTSIRGGDGFDQSAAWQPFCEFVPIVSNNYTQIANDWESYSTNKVVAFTVLNAIGFSGFDIYTNFTSAIILRYEQTPNSNNWTSIQFLMMPYRTPQAHALMLNYDQFGVSNLVLRIRTCTQTQGGHDGLMNWCDKVLSGQAKQEYLDLKAAGIEE